MTKQDEDNKKANIQDYMPPAEIVQQELAKAKSMDDFFGKEGIFARPRQHNGADAPSGTD